MPSKLLEIVENDYFKADRGALTVDVVPLPLTRLDPRGMSPPGRRLPNREARKICEGQLDLNTALGPTRASGFQMNKNRKSDEKSRSPLSAHTGA